MSEIIGKYQTSQKVFHSASALRAFELSLHRKSWTFFNSYRKGKKKEEKTCLYDIFISLTK